MVGEAPGDECAVPAADPLVLHEYRFHVGVFVEPGTERQGFRGLVHGEHAGGQRVLGKCQRMLPVQADTVGFDEVFRLVLRDAVLHVGEDQLVRTAPGQLLVELERRDGVPEVLVDRREEEVEVFHRAFGAPVPQADFTVADIARGMDVQ